MQLSTYLNICFLTVLLHLPLHARSSATGIGRVVTVKGSATVRGVPLSVGDYVRVGDLIETKSDGSVKLLLGDKSVIDVFPSSAFQVKNFEPKTGPDREVDGAVDFGQIRSNITKKLNKKGRFQIKTKSSVLAVRGTEFFVQSNPQKGADRITVSEGKVWVNALNGGAQSENVLSPGQQWNNRISGKDDGGAIASAGKREIQLVSLSKKDLTFFASTQRLRDNTFEKTVTIRETPAEDRTTASQGAKPDAKEPPKGSGKSSGGSATLDTIKDTLDETILGDKKTATVIDGSAIDSPGVESNPTDTLKPITANDPLNQIVNIKVKIE